MKIILHPDAKIRKGVTIIEGFPGFGLVGTIATEYLVDHLRTRLVGEFSSEELPATTAIHDGKLVRPMALHYDDKHNILLFHTILAVKGHEWAAASEVLRIAKQFQAKEIISLEGVNALMPGGESRVFSYGNERFVALGAQEMKEGIVMGVTASLLLTAQNASCLFAETHSQLPDSKAAAAVIGILDKYLGLGVNPEPLLRQAQEFEQKLKSILQQTQKTTTEAEKKSLSYLG